MSARWMQFLAGLQRRERILIALLIVVALPVGLVQGVALPLLARHDAARAAVAEAMALQRWLQERQLQLALLPAADDSPARMSNTPPASLSTLEAGLVEAGLRDSLVTLANPSAANIALRFDDVAFTQLMPWLDAVETGLGYRVSLLRLSQGALPGAVDADVQLEPQQ